MASGVLQRAARPGDDPFPSHTFKATYYFFALFPAGEGASEESQGLEE